MSHPADDPTPAPIDQLPDGRGCRGIAGWVLIVIGAIMALLTVGRLAVLAMGQSRFEDNLAYGIGNALGPGILGVLLILLGVWLRRRPRR